MGKSNAKRKVTKVFRRKRVVSAVFSNLKQFQMKHLLTTQEVQIDFETTPCGVVSNDCETGQSRETVDASSTTSARRLLGRRMVDIQHLLDQLSILDSHDSKYNCSFKNLNFIQEKRLSLSSKLCFKCNMCLNEFYVELNKSQSSQMDINTSVVAGAVSIGIGYSNAQELFESIDIPFLSSRTYAKYHDIVHKG
ncbi:hypothetical protein ILUMI_07747 [Ignelater luminosus]|uniref:Mutator-like transposase domain-containing protein n=1 Tax=Ignelater luminosus TaxID=2038154 RepID=A0A8K0GE30_IGNLU|nr:hypothetical protein ILUMI_07747 [Ignelater luminosus]